MTEEFLKDEEELKLEKSFSKKYVSPYFRDFYIYRYQVLRVMKLSPIEARRRVMAELNIVWEKIGEDLQNEEELSTKNNTEQLQVPADSVYDPQS